MAAVCGISRPLRPAAAAGRGLLRQAKRTAFHGIGSNSYAVSLASEKASAMKRDLISDEDTSIKNFTLNFGPQVRARRGPRAGVA